MLEDKKIKRKRGYLNNNFRIFHLKDRKSIDFEFHYHDFNKIVIFISGRTTYLIEGNSYSLKPWDILLINNRDIHRALIDPDKTYERIILWSNPDFLIKHNDSCNLLSCFELASKQRFNLLRLEGLPLETIKRLLFDMEAALKNKDLGYKVLLDSLFIQLMVYMNRLFLSQRNLKELSDIKCDENIDSVLNYINKNLKGNLSIDNIASQFYMSKYYLMHKFRKQTGYTIHNYILQKRLIMSNLLIKKGKSIMEACLESGFNDYSNFSRAFKKMFGLSPREYYKS
ncbi:AraC family transcriptional regulator [Clostridium luticellarii]|jgi:AraC-like DNA-binding protein/quercetin dioxygenase-like cupin family protein|uniref:AraC family transcriptional regulator n=1 Tax=Clostridium luticellarii TaxID=1691940 RepID=UPI00235643FC|nr:AraC family transcriptional regulator [Clostridium luticellarii]MCI1945771.1 AraC family transcriptional regulator [Clostridium luticellarii]MCI1968477.1 AraC family transcriptional regulator [Clostridium luticellarii]MCI1996005.1 AraC family transcriptional regulator [Clostridium luticellarii]MCI2039871.1 AraC family transcriptional regulator [Clostridium luticellarii]